MLILLIFILICQRQKFTREKNYFRTGNLVLEGIPLPLVIPFGFFPIQTKKAASGIIIPQIGQEQGTWYSLTDGGYYFAISDYFDLSLKGNIYSNGTWLATAQTNYNKII